MKKIYSLAGAVLVSAASFAQGGSFSTKAVVNSAKSTAGHASTVPMRAGSDTTGIGFNVVTNVTFLPEFASGGSVVNYGYLGGGYIFGNNVDNLNICAQGYQNINAASIFVDGVIVWFVGKESDGVSSATSRVTMKVYEMGPNKAVNTNGSGTFNTGTMNDDGPFGAPRATADFPYATIDTNFLVDNYVAFATPPQFNTDFAIAADFTTLADGDTVGIYSDQDGDAMELDYAFHFYSGKWHVTDHLFSDPAAPSYGTGGINNNIAIFAVFGDATGVNEFFNGMKLTTYPNPAATATKIEYTLQKDSRNVSLVVFDQTGRKVIENKYDEQSAGTYKVDVETMNLASGTYFYQLKANGNDFTKKLVVAK